MVWGKSAHSIKKQKLNLYFLQYEKKSSSEHVVKDKNYKTNRRKAPLSIFGHTDIGRDFKNKKLKHIFRRENGLSCI